MLMCMLTSDEMLSVVLVVESRSINDLTSSLSSLFSSSPVLFFLDLIQTHTRRGLDTPATARRTMTMTTMNVLEEEEEEEEEEGGEGDCEELGSDESSSWFSRDWEEEEDTIGRGSR